jgi:hypothetical protein
VGVRTANAMSGATVVAATSADRDAASATRASLWVGRCSGAVAWTRSVERSGTARGLAA